MSHVGHAQVRKKPGPIGFLSALFVFALLMLSSCMTADPQRADWLDRYDRKVAIAPIQATNTAVTPEGHFVVLVQFAHIFEQSQPDPYELRYFPRAIESRLLVFDGQKWQTTALQDYFDYENHHWSFGGISNMGYFDFDSEGRPVLQALKAISPVILVYRNRQWQTVWRGETQARSPKPCEAQHWFLDGEGIVGFCNEFEYEPLTQGNWQGYRTRFLIADSRGQARTLGRDTLQPQIMLKRVRGDTLDYITYQSYSNSGNFIDSQRYTWNRILRKKGLSFADTSNPLKQWPIPFSILPRQLVAYPNGEFYTSVENTNSDDLSHTVHVIEVRNDSVFLSPYALTSPPYFSSYQMTKTCIRNYNPVQLTLDGATNPVRENANGLPSGSGFDSSTFAFHSSCGDAPDTLRIVHPSNTREQASHIRADEQGKVWILHQFAPLSQNPFSYNGPEFVSRHQSTPSDSLETYLRREFAYRLTHWNGQAWQELTWPF